MIGRVALLHPKDNEYLIPQAALSHEPSESLSIAEDTNVLDGS